MKSKNIAIIALILIMAGAAAYFLFNGGAWPVFEEVKIPKKNNPQTMENGNIDLAKVSWNKIQTSRLAGFDSKKNVVELTNQECGGEGHYLRTEGGFIRTGYCLAFNDGAATTTIDSAAKLKEVFAPVDSAEKAISFVAVTEGDYEVDGDIVNGDVVSIDDYYLVRITQKNTFGCGTHVPTKAIFKVAKSGDVTLVSKEEPAPSSTGMEMCVD